MGARCILEVAASSTTSHCTGATGNMLKIGEDSPRAMRESAQMVFKINTNGEQRCKYTESLHKNSEIECCLSEASS